MGNDLIGEYQEVAFSPSRFTGVGRRASSSRSVYFPFAFAIGLLLVRSDRLWPVETRCDEAR